LITLNYNQELFCEVLVMSTATMTMHWNLLDEEKAWYGLNSSSAVQGLHDLTVLSRYESVVSVVRCWTSSWPGKKRNWKRRGSSQRLHVPTWQDIIIIIIIIIIIVIHLKMNYRDWRLVTG
jgi:hypothetical protein